MYQERERDKYISGDIDKDDRETETNMYLETDTNIYWETDRDKYISGDRQICIWRQR